MAKAEKLEVVLGLQGHNFVVGSFVENECSPDPLPMEAALASGSLQRANDSDISANAFANLLGFYELGDGETECIAFADADPELVICSDDGAAREACAARFGENRIVGSLFLLKECVREGIMSSEEAWVAYELMRHRGGFLPDLDENYFSV